MTSDGGTATAKAAGESQADEASTVGDEGLELARPRRGLRAPGAGAGFHP